MAQLRRALLLACSFALLGACAVPADCSHDEAPLTLPVLM